MNQCKFSTNFCANIEEWKKDKEKADMKEINNFIETFETLFVRKLSECDDSGLFTMCIPLPFPKAVKNVMNQLMQQHGFFRVDCIFSTPPKPYEYYFEENKKPDGSKFTTFWVIKYTK